jgi:hypothetical protein
MTLRRLLVALTFAAGAAVLSAASSIVSIIDLGHPGGVGSFGLALNDSGQVVGELIFEPESPSRTTRFRGRRNTG